MPGCSRSRIWTRVALLVALLLMPSFITAAEPDGVQSDDPIYGVIEADALIFQSPSTDAKAWLGPAGVVRLERLEGDWFRVEPPRPGEDETHCGSTYFSRIDVRDDSGVFVRNDALSQVLARPIDVEFDDGTSLRAAAGKPVARTESSADSDTVQAVLSFDGLEVDVQLPTSAISKTYRPRAFPSPTPVRGARPRALGHDLRVDGQALASKPSGASAVLASSTGQTYVDSDDTAPDAPLCLTERMTDDTQHDLGVIEFRCGVLRTRINDDARELSTGWCRSGRTPTLSETFSVEKGADVLWPDGSPLGALRSRMQLGVDGDVLKHGLLCFDPTSGGVAPALDSPLKFAACVRREDLDGLEAYLKQVNKYRVSLGKPAIAAPDEASERERTREDERRRKLVVDARLHGPASADLSRTAGVSAGDAVDAATVDDVFARRRSGLRRCYMRALDKNPDLRVQLLVKLDVARRGRVSEVSTPSAGDTQLARCVRDELDALRFPRTDSGFEVVKAIVFERSH